MLALARVLGSGKSGSRKVERCLREVVSPLQMSRSLIGRATRIRGPFGVHFVTDDVMAFLLAPHRRDSAKVALLTDLREGAIHVAGQKLGRLRYKILFGLIVAIMFPMLVRHFATAGALTEPTLYNTALGSAIALLLGVIGYQRLRVFPGIAAGGYIFMAFSATFGALAVILLLMRIEYSGVQFLSSYVMSLMFYIYVHQKIVAERRLRVGVIPSPETNSLPELPKIDWVKLHLGPQDGAQIDAVVADLHSDHSDAWDEQITRIVLSGTPVYHYKQILEQTTGRVEINHLSENTLGSLNPNDLYLQAKSITDVAIAAILLVLLAPIIAVIAILVRLESPGPALFRQERIGYRGRSFTLYKIRTMRTAPPTDKHSEQESRYAAMTKIGDPRITRLGHLLRRSRLDELPQLINIVRGEMSLIGPRPEAVALSRWYEKEIPFYHYRHIIKPGVSGWAQVNQGHVIDVADVQEKLHRDFYYVKNFSFWLDVLIALRTLRTMASGFGAR